MSIITLDDLSYALDRDFSWRKKELSDLHFYIQGKYPDPTRRTVLGRCGVTILYAHWEGFVKHGGRAYLEYVAMQRLRNNQLHPSLLTLSMCGQALPHWGSRKHSDHGKVTNFFLEKMNSRSAIPWKRAIQTEANLSSKVLAEIVWCLGVEYEPYRSKEHFIDTRLLGARNHIAHGELAPAAADEYDEMRDNVVEMLELFKNQLINAAVTGSYRV
jgi:hypothetical protein